MRRNIPHDDESGAFGLAFMGISPLSLALYFCSPAKDCAAPSTDCSAQTASPKWVFCLGPDTRLGLLQLVQDGTHGRALVQRTALTRAHDHMPLSSDALRIFALGHTLVNRIGKHIRAASTAVPSLNIRPLPVSVALTAAKICSAG